MISIGLGATTENFTATNELFLRNPSITLWRFEVVYSFSSEKSSSALNFLVNQPPRNGSCSIQPENGTTTTPFVVSCPDWFDEDGVKDYSLLSSSSLSGWTTDRTLIAFSSVSIFEVYLPAGQDPFDLLIEIRDRRDCLTEWTNLSSIGVRTDSTVLADLMKNLVNGSTTASMNPFIQFLTRGTHNQVGQMVNSLSQQINRMDEDNLQMATSSQSNVLFDLHRDAFLDGIPAWSTSISPVDASSSLRSSTPLSLSALAQSENELNRQASLRESLLGFLINLRIQGLRSIQIQSTSLTQLTQSTNQLTRKFLVRLEPSSPERIEIFLIRFLLRIDVRV